METPTRTALVPIADGSEEIEAVCLIDVLRRAGAVVTVASVESELAVTCSRGVRITADELIGACTGQRFDLIALPGGMPGAERLRDCAPLIALLRTQRAARRLYGAICAAPAVTLAPHGLLGTRATAHPNFMDRLAPAQALGQRVVVDDGIVTSRGPGTALEFALTLVELLFGADKRHAVAAPLVID
ncbi:DJ-1 family glyoxalase III [Immundisolibacter sp.]|uniref:DJ-1 family glyoxalase III n=1 Tax=Immundisolibacter sp. TaxID=1934948 RepID=UPI00261946C9|nr:DJ-1 family glyoxalase III [Immundisolibacter sp.]MDD3651117.1 DJ-1/PfpI family protein [Immundisolibacter sp.]